MKKGKKVEQKATPLNSCVKPIDLSVGFSSVSSSPTLPLLLVTIAWFAGFTAILAGCSSTPASNSPSPTPTVTSPTSQEIESYARAVLSIETSRRVAYDEIQKMTNNETVPDVTCTETKSIAALSKNLQEIAVNYCERSKKFIENEQLTMDKFNAMTASAQSNQELQQLIQRELIRLQSN
jgi:hypothetical protein